MKTNLTLILIIALLTALISCQLSDERPGDEGNQESSPNEVRDTENETVDVSGATPEVEDETQSSSDGEPLEIPFYLIIDDVTLQDNPEAVIHTQDPVTIQIIGSVSADCELVVLHPDDSSFSLGTWIGDTAIFNHAFPYGENHLLIKWDDSVYDILVVSGAPEPREQGEGCSGAFMDLGPDTVWTFELTDEHGQITSCEYKVFNWMESGESGTTFSISMILMGGIEQDGSPSTTMDLYCSGDTIYINNAIDYGIRTIWNTTYNEGTIYLPSELTAGTTWERHGTFIVDSPDGPLTGEVIEHLRCTGEERVAVSAGEFDAYKVDFRIERTLDENSTLDEGYSWYVPGLGRILSVSEDGSRRLEMTSYTGINPRFQ